MVKRLTRSSALSYVLLCCLAMTLFQNYGFCIPTVRILERRTAVSTSSGVVIPNSSPSALTRPVRSVIDLEDHDNIASPVVLACATALAAASGSVEKSDRRANGVWTALKLPVFSGLWYFFNVQYNIQNKLLLKSFSATWGVSFIQLSCGIPLILFLWASGLVRTPKVCYCTLHILECHIRRSAAQSS